MNTFTREEALDVYENFEGSGGRLFLVRCPVCKRENWSVEVASGQCAWCGAKEDE